jgi:hypothetical protein
MKSFLHDKRLDSAGLVCGSASWLKTREIKVLMSL